MKNFSKQYVLNNAETYFSWKTWICLSKYFMKLLMFGIDEWELTLLRIKFLGVSHELWGGFLPQLIFLFLEFLMYFLQ